MTCHVSEHSMPGFDFTSERCLSLLRLSSCLSINPKDYFVLVIRNPCRVITPLKRGRPPNRDTSVSATPTRCLFFILLVLGLLLYGERVGIGAVLEVGHGKYPNLSTAAARATTGDTILLRGNTYREPGETLRIDKSLRIQGDGNPAKVFMDYPNDSPGNALDLAGSSVRIVGVNHGAGTEANEPRDPTDHSVWYTWQAPDQGAVSISVSASINAHIQVFENGSNPLSTSPLAQNWNRLDLEVRPGQRFLIRVGSISTGFFTLAIQPLAPPTNDRIEDAPLLQGNSSSGLSSTFGATLEAGETKSFPSDAGNSVWWRWRAPSDGVPRPVVFSTAGSSIDTRLSVWKGESRLEWELAAPANDDESPLSTASRVSFMATPGTLYWIRVDHASEAVSGAAVRLSIDYSLLQVSVDRNGLVCNPLSGDLWRFSGRFVVTNYSPIAVASFRLVLFSKGTYGGYAGSTFEHIQTIPIAGNRGRAIVLFDTTIPAPTEAQKDGLWSSIVELDERDGTEWVPTHFDWICHFRWPRESGGIVDTGAGDVPPICGKNCAPSGLPLLTAHAIAGPDVILPGTTVRYFLHTAYSTGAILTNQPAIWSSNPNGIKADGSFTYPQGNSAPISLKITANFTGKASGLTNSTREVGLFNQTKEITVSISHSLPDSVSIGWSSQRGGLYQVMRRTLAADSQWEPYGPPLAATDSNTFQTILAPDRMYLYQVKSLY